MTIYVVYKEIAYEASAEIECAFKTEQEAIDKVKELEVEGADYYYEYQETELL